MAITKIQTGGIPALAVTHDKLHTTMDLSGKTVTLPSAITDTITNKLPLAGGTMTGILTGNRFINATNSSDPWIKGVNTSGVETSYIQQSGNAYFAGNVGIGETSPLGKLHVKTADSGATADAGADELVIEGSGNVGMSILSGASNTGSIYFGDSGTNWDGYIAYSQSSRSMTLGTAAGGGSVNIGSTGNVGIGVSSPTSKLHVSAAPNGGNATAHILQAGATNGPTLTVEQTGGGGNSNVNQGLLIKVDGQNAGVGNALRIIGTNNNLNSGTDINILAVQNGGNVGIGISPEAASKLEINAGADGAVAISARSDGGNGNNRRFNILAYADGGTYGGGIKLQTRNSSNVFNTALTIASTGYVGIGTEAPAERLEIKTASPALKLTDTGNSNNNVKISQGYNSYLTASNDVYMSAGGYSNLFSMINGVIQVKKTTTGNISSGGARQGSVIKLLHSGQWEAGYNSTPTDFLGAVEFSSDDTSGSGLAGAGVRAAIRAPVRDAYNNVGLSFETGGTRAERMLIDYNGRVTMPNQPAFRAIYSGSAISLTNTYFPFNTVSGSYNSFDIGSNFRTSASPSSGTNAHSYTAPVAGRYYFVVSTICNTINNNGAWYLRRNGSAVVEQHTTQTSSGWTAITMTGIINCAAGDYVNVWVGGTTLNLYGVAWGHFSGYLIG